MEDGIHDAVGVPEDIPHSELPPSGELESDFPPSEEPESKFPSSGEPDSDYTPPDLPSSDLPPDDLPLDGTEFAIVGAENSSVGHGEEKWPGWPGHNVFRILVSAQKVGSIIGRKGENIKKMCEETKARIKILDGPPGTSERAVMVSAKEEPGSTMPPAVDALLRVHKRMVDLDGDNAPAPPGQTIITRLLVAATQAGSLIGKQGSTVKTIQDDSGCVIRVLGGENLPLFALQDDSIVEVQGETIGVHKAVELIASHLRKFLVDHGIVAVFEKQMQAPNIQGNQNMPPHQQWAHQGFGRNAAACPAFDSYSQYMQPGQNFDSYYQPADFSQENQSHSRQPPPMFGRDARVGVSPSNAPSHPSIVSKVTQNMQIPLAYADAVIGSSGSNISYIRRSSGATISIQETRGVPGEMTVEISGSTTQIQAAQQMIQNAIAEAASSAQNAAGSMTHNYGSYATHGQVYGSSMAHVGQAPAADYGSTYGAHYGY